MYAWGREGGSGTFVVHKCNISVVVVDVRSLTMSIIGISATNTMAVLPDIPNPHSRWSDVLKMLANLILQMKRHINWLHPIPYYNFKRPRVTLPVTGWMQLSGSGWESLPAVDKGFVNKTCPPVCVCVVCTWGKHRGSTWHSMQPVNAKT